MLNQLKEEFLKEYKENLTNLSKPFDGISDVINFRRSTRSIEHTFGQKKNGQVDRRVRARLGKNALRQALHQRKVLFVPQFAPCSIS